LGSFCDGNLGLQNHHFSARMHTIAMLYCCRCKPGNSLDFSRLPIIYSLFVFAGSKHVKSGFLSGVFQSMVRGMQYRQMQGDISQQGGAFILGPGLLSFVLTRPSPMHG
jgi:hypothetical protein